MAKGAEAFRSIGEVATLLGVAPHVLRYWETQFTALKPMKRPDGRRYYRPADVDMAAGICALLRDDGLTIRGAIKQIASDRGQGARQRGADHLSRIDLSPALPTPPTISTPAHQPVTPNPAIWLWRLTGLARHLQRIDTPSPATQPTVLRLAQAMLRLS